MQSHRVYSKHFVRGCKTYLNNVPTITPKMEIKEQSKERPTIKARNRQSVSVIMKENAQPHHLPVAEINIL